MERLPDIDIREHLNYYLDAYDDDGNLIYGKKIEQKKKIYGGDWVAFFQKSLTYIAKLGLTGEQHNVLWAMMGKLDFENYVRISQEDLAKELNLKPPNVGHNHRGTARRTVQNVHT